MVEFGKWTNAPASYVPRRTTFDAGGQGSALDLLKLRPLSDFYALLIQLHVAHQLHQFNAANQTVFTSEYTNIFSRFTLFMAMLSSINNCDWLLLRHLATDSAQWIPIPCEQQNRANFNTTMTLLLPFSRTCARLRKATATIQMLSIIKSYWLCFAMTNHSVFSL